MLKLTDFFHLPVVDTTVEQLVAARSGLIVVAGLDLRSNALTSGPGGFLSSGRSTIFRILMRDVMEAHPPCIIVAEDRDAVRPPRHLRDRVHLLPVTPAHPYDEHIVGATQRRPGLIVVDRLSADSAPAALAAARKGRLVLSQLDTVFRGANVARHLLDLGAARDDLAGLAWVVAVQRLAMLCPHCKQPVPPDELDRLRQTPSGAGLPADAAFFRAGRCAQCDHTGRRGDVVLFDFFHASGATAPALFDEPSQLPVAGYALELAALGHLALDDVLHFDAEQIRRTFNLFATSEQALVTANAELERKLVELEVANRVMEQRTRALVSFQEMGQALIGSSDLEDLADRACRSACDLCGADRAILYYRLPDGRARVLAVGGWEPDLLGLELDAGAVFAAAAEDAPQRFNHWPPGIAPRPPDVEGAALRAGLAVPLVAGDQQAGLMIVHSTRRNRFEPGEIALLQTFADQAALAIQRAGLIADLRAKIAELEAAQAELAHKERMERELELARQVQQSMLPRTFPQVAGFRFAARSDPARQVGGDFYDVFPLDADRFGITVADVSDKGMPAALYMALTRSLLLAEARRTPSPRAVLQNINRLLMELSEPNMFVTMFYAVVDRASRRLTYARAGHERPILLRDGAIHELPGQGPLLGLFDNEPVPLSEDHLDLAPGDRLVLYTDGLTDVPAPDGRLLERDEFVAMLQGSARRSADDLCAAVFDAVAAYRQDAPQFDDMTMLVVEIQ